MGSIIEVTIIHTLGIIQMFMETEYNPLPIIIKDQKAQLHCVEMAHTALAKVEEVLVRIMVGSLDGIKV
jgi:hypothetical protein